MHRTLRAYELWQRNGIDMAMRRRFCTKKNIKREINIEFREIHDTSAFDVGLLERGEDTALKEFVDSESRSYKGEKFNRFAAEVHARVKNLLQRYARGCVMVCLLFGTMERGTVQGKLHANLMDFATQALSLFSL